MGTKRGLDWTEPLEYLSTIEVDKVLGTHLIVFHDNSNREEAPLCSLPAAENHFSFIVLETTLPTC